MRALLLIGTLLGASAAHADPGALLTQPVSGLDGKPLNLAALKGQVVLLDLWATWCDPCRASLPGYQALYEKLGPKGFSVVALSVDEQAGDARAFVERAGLKFPIGWDPKGAWPARLNLETMPTAWLLARDGSVAFVHPGFREGDLGTLEEKIAALLATPAPLQAPPTVTPPTVAPPTVAPPTQP